MKRLICLLCIAALSILSLFSCNNDDEWEKQVAAYRAAKRAAYILENERYADYEVDAAFIGDSLTDAYNVEEYYPNIIVSNRGIGGDKTYDLYGRLQVSLYDLKPKVVVMLIGGNNLDSMFDDYEDILIGFKENLPKTKIILLSLTSMGGEHWGKNNELAAYNNVKIKLLAEKYGHCFVDLYTPLFNLESGEIYSEYTTDGGHLTEKGYEVLTREIMPNLTAQLYLWKTEFGGD